jgi:tagatose-6-phosphate ketose/aldose isomerase
MANQIKSFIALSDAERKARGLDHTPREILQQPRMWLETGTIMVGLAEQLKDYLADCQDRQIILSGAGTSEFIGKSLENLFNKISGYETKSVATTSIITDPEAVFRSERKYVLVHFARSGNSPESIGTYLLAQQSKADVKHIVITCNKDGKLASLAKETMALTIVLPKETHDQGLAMTSSFSSMVVAGLCLATVNSLQRTAVIIEKIARAADVVMENYSETLASICELDFNRAVFLGSNTLAGCAKECHLKLQEMTNGKVMGQYDTFLGLRHGPEVVINENTLVVYLLSEDPWVRKYEMDMVAGMHTKGCGLKKIALCKKADSQLLSQCDFAIEHQVEGIPDDFLTPVYVLAGQLLGLFKSLNYELKPDTPSPDNVITRVVQGVKIYDRAKYAIDESFETIAELS